MPIFYDVDPSDIRKQKGDFGVAFKKTCEGIAEEKKRRWIEALTCVATIVGEHSRNWDNIEKVSMFGKFATDVTLSWDEKKEMIQWFRLLDVNQNGFITAADYQKYILTNYGKKVTDEDAHNFIKAFDVDCDGQVSYDEFVKLTR
ncbi:unnamed protein product [Brassica rapa subsp. trilocularis]